MKLSNCIVISQPMYFPWVGLLEQIKLSNIFVYYDDVQYSRGFLNRVQIKYENGQKWITVPLKKFHQSDNINHIEIDNSIDWRRNHLNSLMCAYRNSPYVKEMISLVESVFVGNFKTLDEISIASTAALIGYFDLNREKSFYKSSDLNIIDSSTERLLKITKFFSGEEYLTGHGAANYLKHELFEEQGIKVLYIKYGLNSYSQCHGDFIPYVSALDLIANCGKSGANHICATPINWRKFLQVQ